MNNISINKDCFWQQIRGICIICVILIHCVNGASYSEINTLYSWNFDYWIIMRQVINFPVAIFIFLAGYFTKIESVENEKYSYIRNRIKRLLIPFLVWSTFYTLLNVVFLSGSVNVFEIIVKIIFGLSSGQLYFILVLLQLMIITPFLVNVIKNKKHANLLFFITPLYLLCIYLYACYFKER